MKEWFFDNNGIFQWGSITALVAIGTLIFSYLNFINSRKTINQHKELELGKQESAKKNHIREKISEYLAELTKMNQVAKNFFEVRRELEGAQNFLAQMIQNSVDLDNVLGNNPKSEVENRSIKFNECIVQWTQTSEKVEQKAQELLLLFRNDEQEENEIDKLIMFCPQRLSGLKWILTTNLPGDMLHETVGEFSIERNIVEIRTFMRDYLN